MPRQAPNQQAEAGGTIGVPARPGTRRYSKFIVELREALSSSSSVDIAPLLDGKAGTRCLDLVGQPSIRRLGAFFTPTQVATRLVNEFPTPDWSTAVVLDPACGAADLLLAIARKLPVKRTASSTLRTWNGHLLGCDVSPEFIEAARLRLVLLAVERGASMDDSPTNLAALLTNLRVANGLLASDEYGNCSHVLMNPPYGRVESEQLLWREGLVTAAALFVERAARLCRSGTEIVALLPEVLRTGSSYQHWRRHVEQFALSAGTHSIGRFSDQADVDVFIQRFTKRERPALLDLPQTPAIRSVGDKFTVSVGSVVPHRDAQKGPTFAFLHAGNAPAWSEVSRIRERRRFEGRVFKAPFVVVRRTSRPGDTHRAVATLVLGNRRVAVENHLLVLEPKRGGAAICRELVRILKTSTTDNVLNNTMRCRHLTTASVSSVPWP
ncbi:MAG: N-6 DNA methylase [Pseudorhodoplanes sp.]